MRPIPERLRRETVTRAASLGSSAYGAQYDTPATRTGYYCEPRFQRVTDKQGKEVIASLFAIGPAADTWAAGDKLTWNGSAYLVIDAQPLRPCGVVHHQELYCQGVDNAD